MLKMTLSDEQVAELQHFFGKSNFSTEGAVITDLDGTAVHEVEGRTVIHRSVEVGLKRLYDIGRPIVINTLRFPLSVIRTFAHDWYLMSNGSIPVILLNGSQLGYITKHENDFAFEQLASFPLTKDEVATVYVGIEKLVNDSIKDFILFIYPEDWTKGEIIWTPDAERIPHFQEKYKSASQVISTTIEELQKMLHSNPICMFLLLLDIPTDRLMAYQHTKRSNFITHKGVDKLFGAEQMAKQLSFKLTSSIGAGDTDMDVFLKGVGLSVHIGNPSLSYKGQSNTLRLRDFVEFGDLLFRFAEMQYAVAK
ncbi:MAG: HAD family phosphatase [Chitinophagaceae bacterium]|nr:HAD family phosphatase [Chitinophagaceae bacterium]